MSSIAFIWGYVKLLFKEVKGFPSLIYWITLSIFWTAQIRPSRIWSLSTVLSYSKLNSFLIQVKLWLVYVSIYCCKLSNIGVLLIIPFWLTLYCLRRLVSAKRYCKTFSGLSSHSTTRRILFLSDLLDTSWIPLILFSSIAFLISSTKGSIYTW